MSEERVQPSGAEENAPNFISDMVREDLAKNKHPGRLNTRFPPEPNGYLHIGHAKSITLNFGTAELAPFGKCNLRFDDTNPTKEETEFVESIQNDVRWLGYDWQDRLYFASDYFERLYECAVDLIRRGLAYVDSQSLEEIRKNRGDFYTPGTPSPFRERSAEENLDLLARMRKGDFEEGVHVLRAKIDMASADLNLRDPLLYRIKHAHHHRTGDAWCIYPMYDYAHPLSDAFEGITHSLCTLEFAHHRPLYDWLVAQFSFDPVPEQTEFAKLALTYTVLSKRRLQALVVGGQVNGWNDPRMPTLAGLRRRGFTPAALRRFCERIGVSRRDSVVDVSLLEHAVREDLNATSPRVLAVLRPLKITLTNFPEHETIELDAQYNSENPSWGSRKVPLTRELYIERDDFLETPVKGWFRLSPGAEVRLRYACIITCNEVVKNEAGEIVELKCTWDPDSLGGQPKDGRKIKGTIHWVSEKHALTAEVRLYDRLFTAENPLDEAHYANDTSKHEHPWMRFLNPNSLEVVRGAKLEPSLAKSEPLSRVQFERLGYFCADEIDSKPGALVFNRTISLKDGWAKAQGKGK
ncbi:MAG: glutamine--tRNA ligase/YqeY domain fusion protein [Myxococcales bacterium]